VESEGILGGVGVGRNFGWSRSRKEFWVGSESEGILGGVGVGRNCGWGRSRKEFWVGSELEGILGGVLSRFPDHDFAFSEQFLCVLYNVPNPFSFILAPFHY
jgi:hypothetical protein